MSSEIYAKELREETSRKLRDLADAVDKTADEAVTQHLISMRVMNAFDVLRNFVGKHECPDCGTSHFVKKGNEI